MKSNNRIFIFVKENYFVLVFTFGLIAFIFTLVLVGLFIEPLHLFYLTAVSILFAVLITQIMYEAGIRFIELNIRSAILIFIFTYIALTAWYGAMIAYPEYKNILEFRMKRTDLIYNVQKNSPPPESHLAYRRQLAELYLHADSGVNKLEPNVNLRGVSLMQVFLEEQINNGNGNNYRKYMYDLAEVAFTVASKELAKKWYQKAQEYGVPNAMNRYQERMDKFNKESYR